jgi:hypothetical protein
MTMDLVTGMGPGPHIDGRAWGELNAGIIGPDDYVLQIGDRLACTMQTANKAVIGTGAAVMQGRHVTITQPETVTIQSGTQGQKRNDLICLRYERDTTTNIETARMVAYKGTPTTGTPTDPTTGTGDILALSDSHDMPLYRIPLDGISVGTPIPLYKTLTPVGVPRTPTPRTCQVYALDGVINWTVRGGVCYATIDAYYAADPWSMNTGDTRQLNTPGDLPKAAIETRQSHMVAAGGIWNNPLGSTVTTDGIVKIVSLSRLYVKQNEHVGLSVSYPVAS